MRKLLLHFSPLPIDLSPLEFSFARLRVVYELALTLSPQSLTSTFHYPLEGDS